MIEAITPDDVSEQKKRIIPDNVLETWNNVIAQNYCDGTSTIRQNYIVDELVRVTGKERSFVFDKHWLDIEEIYRAAGWKVVYDKPAYNESYEPTFTFSRKR